ncbi:hypothetical protein TURU_144211 [Turdus rufiventris]|nr:hypothetical protein TURU_144211 [Turdus rufiventris]
MDTGSRRGCSQQPCGTINGPDLAHDIRANLSHKNSIGLETQMKHNPFKKYKTISLLSVLILYDKSQLNAMDNVKKRLCSQGFDFDLATILMATISTLKPIGQYVEKPEIPG